MYTFEGNYRRTPQQNLAGASRVEGKAELINRLHYERIKRQEQRKKENCAVLIQAWFRGFISRKQFKSYFIVEFDWFSDRLSASPNICMDDIIFLIRRVPFFGIKKPDALRVGIITRIVLHNKEIILKEMNFDWIWRIKMLLQLNIHLLKDSDNSNIDLYQTSLQFIEFFTNYESVAIHMKEEIAIDLINKVYIYAILKDYFCIGFYLLKLCYDEHLKISLDPSYPLRMLTRPFLSFNYVTNEKYKNTILVKFCSTLNNMNKQEIHPSVIKILLPELKQSQFPYVEFLKAIMQIDTEESASFEKLQYSSILLYCVLYFDNNKTVFEKKEGKTYFKLLALLSRNLFTLKGANSDGESDDESEVEDCEQCSEQKILRECSSLLNDSKKAEAWVIYLNYIFENEVWDTLIDFASCLHHLLICGHFPVYHYRIFLLLTYHNNCLKGFWQCISQLKRAGTFSDPVPLISILARGMMLEKQESSHLIPLLSMFCYILKFCYSIMPDEEFYAADSSTEPTKPFSLAEMISLSKTLKDIAVGIILLAYPDTHGSGIDQSIQFHAPTSNVYYNVKCWKTLMQEVVGLVSLLNARDSRKHYTKEGHWLSNFISIPDNIPVYDSTKSMFEPPFICSLSHSRVVITHNINGVTLLSTHESRNVYILSSIPFTIGFLKRFSILQNHFDVDRLEYQNPLVHYLQTPHYFVRIRRHYLYEDAFDKLSGENAPDLKLTVKIQMVNKWGLDEAGVDGGGVFREFIMELLKTAFDPNRGFFIYNNNNELYPNPNVNIICPDFEKHYFFIGRILGKAIYEGIMAEIPLTDFFLAKLTGDTTNLYLHNLASLDPELYKNIMNLRRYNGDFAELGLDFTIYTNEYGRSLSRELKPNGGEIPVTADNVTEYIDLVAKFKMHEEISQQTYAFKEGLRNVFTLDWLKMFSPRELQVIISGDEAPIDIMDMKTNTVYAGGFSIDHPCIVMFWNVLESFSNSERSQLLKFITSCSRPPLLGFKEFNPKICIQFVEGINDRFPTSSTCMNLLKLPSFSDEPSMRSKLLYAIQSGAGFELS